MFFSVLFFISIFIVFFGEFIYPRIIVFLPKKPIKKISALPNVTILIPAYNEELAIADKIKNTFSLDYPKEKIEIIVIDNGSSDRTYEIASRFPVKLLKSERGKINALNKGIESAKTDFIVMTDADVEVSANSVKSAISYFGEDVGAVNGYVVASAGEGNSLMREKQVYKKKDWELRYRESLVDSACNLDGKFLIFKKSIFSKFSKDEMVDDYPMTFSIREKGYRLIVDKSAKIYERLKESPLEELKQFQRYALSIVVINFKNIKFLFNPKYGYFGLLTFPFRRFFPVLYPFFMLYSTIFLLIAALPLLYNLSVSAMILVFSIAVMAFILLTIAILRRKKLMLIHLFAIVISYFDLFKKNNLKLGEWATRRKN